MASAVDPMLVVVQRADDRVVTDAVRRLKPVDREIVMLDVWEGLSRAEIADAMDMTRAAVDQRIHRAYQKLSRSLQPVLEISSLKSPPAAEEGGT
jgi:RNA polymerase sigma factor (sigma-70 family)